MTTPDKEEMPTEDRTVGPWRQSARRPFQIYRGDDEDEHVATTFGSTHVQSLANAQFIVTACNAYEPMREALQGYIDNCTNEECEYCINAWAALNSTGRQTSDDVGILRKALKRLLASYCTAITVLGANQFAIDTDPVIREARAALKGVPQPASDEVSK